MKHEIPFPASDPRYYSVWNQIHKQGRTLEEAMIWLESRKERAPRKKHQKKADQPENIEPIRVELNDINELVLDELCLLHGDFKRMNDNLSRIADCLERLTYDQIHTATRSPAGRTLS